MYKSHEKEVNLSLEPKPLTIPKKLTFITETLLS